MLRPVDSVRTAKSGRLHLTSENACDSLGLTTTTRPEQTGRQTGRSMGQPLNTNRGASKRELAVTGVEIMEITPLEELDGGERVRVTEDGVG